MKPYRVINVLSPTFNIVFEGSYDECYFLKKRLGFGYMLSLNENFDKRFSRKSYDKRKLPNLYFTKDCNVKCHLFLKGDEYPHYIFNYQRMIDLISNGIISENKHQKNLVN